MQQSKLEMEDFIEFETYLNKIKEEIADELSEEPANGASEDII